MNKVAQTLGCIGLVIVAAIVCVGLYLGGWWLTADQTNRQAHVDRLNNGTQLTYTHKVSDNIAEIAGIDGQILNPKISPEQKAGLEAQKTAIVTTTCYTYSLITDAPAPEVQWAAQNCG